jgi:hypothetical protein
MTGTSRTWTMADATAGLEGAAKAVAQGGFEMIAAGALLYVRGVYWESPKLTAKEVADRIHAICEGLNYGRSSRYQLANAALKVARGLQKRWGVPDAAKDRNIAWLTLEAAPCFADAVAMMVTEIKATYRVDTLAALYWALNPATATAVTRKPLPDRILRALQKERDEGTLQAGELRAALLGIAAMMSGDEIAALLPELTGRIVLQAPLAAAA